MKPRTCFSMLILMISLSSLTAAEWHIKPYLVYPGSPSKMRVLWELKTKPGNTHKIEWGTSSSYGESATPSIRDDSKEVLYEHIIENLSPHTKIYYRITADNLTSSSFFYTAPSGSAKKTTFYAYGDSRDGPNNFRHDEVNKAMLTDVDEDQKNRNTMVIHSGDFNNADHGSSWIKEHFRLERPNSVKFYSRFPYMVSRGNHEKGAVGLKKYFPYADDLPDNYYYYSFDYGPVHFTIIDSDQGWDGVNGSPKPPITPDTDQYKWIENDLAGTNKAIKIAMFHKPAYSAGQYGVSDDRKALHKDLFVTYGVTAVINGHSHFCSQSMVDGIAHITLGGGGASLDDPDESEQYVEFARKSRHFARFEVSDGHKLAVSIINSSNIVFHQFTLSGATAADPMVSEDDSPFRMVTRSNQYILHYTMSEPGLTAFTLYDLRGKPVHSQKRYHYGAGNFTLALDCVVSAGLYILKVASVNEPLRVQKKVPVIIK